jgi:hypothetical protein
MTNVEIDGVRYAPIDEDERTELGELIHEFTLEGDLHWKELFIRNDSDKNGRRYGMYSEGDEKAPFFTEAFLYNLLGKDEARSVLGIMRRLCKLAGVDYR